MNCSKDLIEDRENTDDGSFIELKTHLWVQDVGPFKTSLSKSSCARWGDCRVEHIYRRVNEILCPVDIGLTDPGDPLTDRPYWIKNTYPHDLYIHQKMANAVIGVSKRSYKGNLTLGQELIEGAFLLKANHASLQTTPDLGWNPPQSDLDIHIFNSIAEVHEGAVGLYIPEEWRTNGASPLSSYSKDGIKIYVQSETPANLTDYIVLIGEDGRSNNEIAHTIAHEIGHVLGLDDLSAASRLNNLMYFRTGFYNTTLTTSQKERMRNAARHIKKYGAVSPHFSPCIH